MCVCVSEWVRERERREERERERETLLHFPKKWANRIHIYLFIHSFIHSFIHPFILKPQLSIRFYSISISISLLDSDPISIRFDSIRFDLLMYRIPFPIILTYTEQECAYAPPQTSDQQPIDNATKNWIGALALTSVKESETIQTI